MTVLGTTVTGHEVAEANTDVSPAAHLKVMRHTANATCGLPW